MVTASRPLHLSTTTVPSFYLYLSTTTVPSFYLSTCPRPPFFRSTSLSVHDHLSFVLPLHLSTTTVPSFYLYLSDTFFVTSPVTTTVPSISITTTFPSFLCGFVLWLLFCGCSFYLSTCPRPPFFRSTSLSVHDHLFVFVWFLRPPLHLSRPPFVRPTSPPVTTTVRSSHLSTCRLLFFVVVVYLSTCPRPPSLERGGMFSLDRHEKGYGKR
ncbi:hypothetical protein J6590_099511 [Homalodisca vitripennis]|nr:hypothetical protein J6590_099511 [Homalodisca vitripennis]